MPSIVCRTATTVPAWLLSAGVLCTTGCRTLDSYVQIDQGARDRVHRQDIASVVSGDGLSRYTREVLTSLGSAWDPARCRSLLADVVAAPLDPAQRQFAVAELSLAASRASDCPMPRDGLQLRAAHAAYSLLAAQEYPPHAPPAQLTVAMYNAAVAEVVTPRGGVRASLRAAQDAPASRIDLPLGLSLDAAMPGAPEGVDQLVDADRMTISGLQARHRRAGVGAALVAVRSRAGSGELAQHVFAHGLAVAVTATAHFDASGDARLALHASDHEDTVCLGAQRWPLAADFSAPYAWTQSGSAVRRHGFIGAFLPGHVVPDSGIYLLEPFSPDKTPILMIHGFASSPQAWRNLTNEIYGTPDLRRRFQVWHYSYPSGLPHLYSAHRLREELVALRAKLRAAYGPRAVRPLIVVGHSQGGLLARALTTDPGDVLWDAVFAAPPDALDVTPRVRDALAGSLLYEPVPDVARVIFMATPHHGAVEIRRTPWAWLLNLFVDVPDRFAREFRRLYRMHPEQLTEPARPWFARGGPTAIDSMAPDGKLMKLFGELPLSQGVHYHSLISRSRTASGREAGDGVIRAASAHVVEAESEVFVDGGHQDTDRAAVFVEITRILRAHPTPAPGAIRAPLETCAPGPTGAGSMASQ